MLHDQRAHTRDDDTDDSASEIRDIHALTPLPNPSSWEANSHRSSTLSLGSELENFTSMSTEFNAMVVAGSTLPNDSNGGSNNGNNDGAHNLARIGEEELEETNPLAIVPDNNPIPSPRRRQPAGDSVEEISVHMVKKEEAESKISAWQTAEIAKINNRFKREDVVINGWESEQVEKSTAWLKKIERKLDEKRAKAVEKMQNSVAKARRKAEEKRATAEAKRGTKVARVLELASLLRTMGRAPSKRSFF